MGSFVRKLPGVLYVTGVLAIAGVALSGGGRYLESFPGFCASCHEMKFFGRSYHESGASRHHPDCISCHSGPGLGGMVGAQMTGLRELAIHFWGTPHPSMAYVPGVVPNENCVKCHVHGYLRDAHQDVPVQGRACAECHNHYQDQDFGGQVPFSPPLPDPGLLQKRIVQ